MNSDHKDQPDRHQLIYNRVMNQTLLPPCDHYIAVVLASTFLLYSSFKNSISQLSLIQFWQVIPLFCIVKNRCVSYRLHSLLHHPLYIRKRVMMTEENNNNYSNNKALNTRKSYCTRATPDRAQSKILDLDENDPIL